MHNRGKNSNHGAIIYPTASMAIESESYIYPTILVHRLGVARLLRMLSYLGFFPLGSWMRELVRDCYPRC